MHALKDAGGKKMSVWNAWGVLSHLPPNSHAENLRQIFILRPVSSLIQSKWMQQQTNLSNPTSKQLCSPSPWLKDTDIAEKRSAGREEVVSWKAQKASRSALKATCWLLKGPLRGSPLVATMLGNSKLFDQGGANYCSSGVQCFHTHAAHFFTWADCPESLTNGHEPVLLTRHCPRQATQHYLVRTAIR